MKTLIYLLALGASGAAGGFAVRTQTLEWGGGEPIFDRLTMVAGSMSLLTLSCVDGDGKTWWPRPGHWDAPAKVVCTCKGFGPATCLGDRLATPSAVKGGGG